MGEQTQNWIFEGEAQSLTPYGLEDAANGIVSIDKRTTKAFKKFINGIESNVLDYLADPKNKENVKWGKIGFRQYPMQKEKVLDYVERSREPRWDEIQEMIGDGDPSEAWDEIVQRDWGTELVPVEKMEEHLHADFKNMVLETLYEEDDAAYDVYKYGSGHGGADTFKSWAYNVDEFMKGINAGGLVDRLLSAIRANIYDEIERLREKLGIEVLESETMQRDVILGDMRRYEDWVVSTGEDRKLVVRNLRKVEDIFYDTDPTVAGFEKAISELQSIMDELERKGIDEEDIEIFDMAKYQYADGKEKLKRYLG